MAKSRRVIRHHLTALPSGAVRTRYIGIVVARILAVFLAAASLAFGESWGECHLGPFRVISSAGDKPARDKLAELAQLRHGLSETIGMPDLDPIWPIHIVISSRDTPGDKFLLGRDAYEIALSPHGPVPDSVKADLARILLDEGTRHVPRSIEAGLIAVFSTLTVSGVHVTVGAPPPERTRDWARMEMLIADPQNYGEVHIFFSNLEQGATLDTAYQNAFQKKGTDIERQVDEYLRSGASGSNSLNALPLSEERDLRVHALDKSEGELARADLLLSTDAAAAARVYPSLEGMPATEGLAFCALAGGNKDEARRLFSDAAQMGSKNPRVWYELGRLETDATKKRADLDKSAVLSTRWDAPFLALADTEPGPVRRALWLKKACAADPRNTRCWVRLAQADEEAKQFDDAVKAWVLAENSASTDAEREQLRQSRYDAEQHRADYEIAERKREEAERQAEIDRVKNASLDEIRAAEAQANAKLGQTSAAGAVSWSELTKSDASAEGTLASIECTGKQMRLVVHTAAGAVRILADPERLSLEGDVTTAKLACGAQDPARKVIVHYNRIAGRRSGVIGQAVAIEYR